MGALNLKANLHLPTSVLKYLVTIFLIGKTKQNINYVKNQEIAERLQVKAPSVTNMLVKLENRGLVTYTKRKGVKLTSVGKQITSEIINQPNDYIGTVLTVFAELLEEELPEIGRAHV